MNPLMAPTTWRALALVLVGFLLPRLGLAQTSQWVATCPGRAMRALEAEAFVAEEYFSGAGQVPEQHLQPEQPTAQ